ncbi:spore coat protein [Paenibacillus physcomitrellae]|uniref:Spore coat protein n=1 Tax=Paenibacillus physcomitrellae TaxID=1619311 RepID=A0ABQ1FYF5_9BACL|nr:spore coat protein [Paenibacillus physcomitrellae]GGA32316.1 spore coat protein [Paenibacillus physcomitrellae]
MYRSNPQHLAWHETLELHELTAFQSNQLILFKMHLNDITDPELKALYVETIKSIESNLKELLKFYPKAPQGTRGESKGMDMTGFYAALLLGFAKTAIRSYAIAITETSTPALRETLHKQLDNAIKLHAKIFHFMQERGLYAAYDLHKLLENDVNQANKAISL